MSDPQVTVLDRPELERYELIVDGTVVAIEDYTLDGSRIALNHTEVAAGHEGKGYAKRLVDEVLADARRRGLGVLPYCPYVAKVIANEPDRYLALVPQELREGFGLPA